MSNCRFVCVRYPLFHRQTASLRKMKLYILTVWFFIVLTILFEVIFLEDDTFRMNPCKACTWTQYFSDKVWTSCLLQPIQENKLDFKTFKSKIQKSECSSIGPFPKWSRTFIEFSEFSKFRESDKSLMHELGSILRYCLSHLSCW